ncbi:DUF4460 domain-containing protein [archaeon]|nr:MAG: DUF4460 domain-containing protein [archaeon]
MSLVLRGIGSVFRPSYVAIVVRSMASVKKKAKNRRMIDKFQSMPNTASMPHGYPDFTYLLRQLYKRSHPDLIRHSHPESAKVNDASMQLLNSIVSTIKKPDQFPPRLIQDIPFHIKGPNSTELSEYVLSIRTAGGDCRKQLTTTFEQFFMTTQLADPVQHAAHYSTGKFVWNKEYFPILSEEEKKRMEEEENYEKVEEKY